MPVAQSPESDAVASYRTSGRFPAGLRSAGEARQFVAATCTEWSLKAVIPAAELVVTELVENVVEHTGSGCTVELALDGGALRIAVSDDDGGEPHVQHPDPREPGGRGLLLISSMAREWGVAPSPSGKTVWATLALD